MENTSSTAPRIFPLADRGLCIDWGNRIDPALNARVQALFVRLQHARLPGVLDLAPAYSSLGILFDAARLLRERPGESPFETIKKRVEQLLQEPLDLPARESKILEIPVCYAPAFAPDLHALALQKGLSPQEVVQLHSGREYRVYLIGFLPGFPYLGSVDARIAAPRREQPRPRVAAGSVGIAGEQTGVYPLESPGGWNLVGRTPLRLFDPARPGPVLLRPGDRVRFFSISTRAFHQIHGQP